MPLAYHLMEESDVAISAAMDALTVGKDVLCDEEYQQLEKEMVSFVELVCWATLGQGLSVVHWHGSLNSLPHKYSCAGNTSLYICLRLLAAVE